MPEEKDNATNEDRSAPTMTVSDFDTARADSLDDLIPPELRKAFEEHGTHTDVPANTANPTLPPEDETHRSISQQQPVDEDSDDVDISPDSIERILKGDFSPAEPQEVEKPFWAEDEDYIDVSAQLSNYGLKPDAIDGLLKKVADRYTVDNGTLVRGLEEQLSETKKVLENTQAAQQRLLDLERGVLFDELQETKVKYGAPLVEAANDIQAVLTREGAKVSVNQILGAKNKTEVLNLIEGSNLSEKDVVRVMEQWRSYKDTETAYYADKKEAKEKGIGAVTARISDETVGTIFKNGLRSLIKSKDDYSYINTAIQQGIDKPEHADVGSLIGLGKTNAFSFIKALQNPTEHLHSQEWMEGLVKYTLDSAHNKHIASQVPTLKSKNTELETTLKKVVVEYKKLAASAKGLNGSKSVGVVRGGEATNGSAEGTITKEDLEKLTKGDFSKLLEGIPSLRD